MLRSVFLFAVLLSVAACGDAPPPPPADSASDEAYRALERLDHEAMDTAYARLSTLPHTITLRLERLDASGESVASASRTVRRQPTADGFTDTLLAADSSGSFDDETFSVLTVSNPLARLLPDEPAFLNPRTREHYHYALRDTTLDGIPLRVLEARRRGTGDEALPVRRARYLLDDDAVVGVGIERLSESALFDEASSALVRLTSGPSGLVPLTAVSETTVDVPGSAPRRLRLEQTVTLERTR